MEKKVLLAVDGSVNAMEAVHYAAQMASTIPDLQFVLMYVQPTLSQYLLDEARIKPNARKALEKAMKINELKADDILSQAVQRLKRKGVDESRLAEYNEINSKAQLRLVSEVSYNYRFAVFPV